MKLPSYPLSSILLLVSLLLVGAAGAQALPRGTNPNLLSVSPISSCYSTFSCTGSSNGWALSGDAVSDTAHKSAGKSVKFSSVGSWLASGRYWSVTPETTYTFSVYMKTDGNLPQALPQIIVGLYDNSDTWLRNVAFEVQSTSDAGSDWQEVVVAFQPKSGETEVGFKIEMMAQANEATTPATVWVSDAYMGEGVLFDRAASAKSAFDGSLVKIDERGNFEIKQDGDWQAFFPICIYADGARTDWSVYKEKGFNCNMWAGSSEIVRKSKAAGLLSGYQIAQYIIPGNVDYNHTGDLGIDIGRLAAHDLEPDVRDSVLFYYWDNENAELKEWSVPAAVAVTINGADRDDNDNRMHPIYSLQGQEGLARKYNPDGVVSGTVVSDSIRSMSDTVGTYVSQDAHNGTAAYTETMGQTILQNIEQQQQPVSMAIFNGNANDGNYAGAQFRAAAYTAIAHGATGIGYWRDCVSGCTGPDTAPQLETTAWWTDLAGLAAVIQSQLPAIQAPPATTWQLSKTVVTPRADNVQWGLRMLGGVGYVIAGNEKSTVSTPEFTITGSLGYTPTSVVDAFTRDWMSDVSSGVFSLPLAANDGGIYLLGSKVPDTLALKLEFTGNLDDASVASNSGGVLSSSGAAISGNTLALSGGDVKIPAHPSLEMNGNLTIVARTNISSSQSGYATIVDKGALTPNMAGYFFFYDPATSQLRFWYGKGGSGSGDRNTLHATVPSLPGGWHTVAVSAKLDGTVTFYVDGQDYAGTGTVIAEDRNTMANPAQPLQIGAAGLGNYLQGSIDDLRIYKAALTKSEINAL